VTVPAAVRAAWGWGDDVEVAPLTGGLINATFAVRLGGAPIAVVQRLHPVFAGEVNLDLERVTAHLAERGLVTPRLGADPRGRALDHRRRAPVAGPDLGRRRRLSGGAVVGPRRRRR
jgi:hypothetical protein